QMSSLERQARRAEEYHRIKDELRDLDLRVMAARQRMWAGEVSRLGGRLSALHDEETALLDEIRRSRGASSEAQEQRAANEERLRLVDEELTAQRLVATEAQARMESLVLRRDELAKRAREAEQEIGGVRSHLLELDAEAGVLGAEVERLAA